MNSKSDSDVALTSYIVCHDGFEGGRLPSQVSASKEEESRKSDAENGAHVNHGYCDDKTDTVININNSNNNTEKEKDLSYSKWRLSLGSRCGDRSGNPYFDFR